MQGPSRARARGILQRQCFFGPFPIPPSPSLEPFFLQRGMDSLMKRLVDPEERPGAFYKNPPYQYYIYTFARLWC